jgi:preprotein translocase subunit SecG
VLYVLYTIHVLICFFLILVVLLQQGSGADLSVFGGGATQTAFGARSATSLLHRLTVGAFVGFIVTTITIGFVRMGPSGGSVMTDVPATTAAEPDAQEAAPAAAETPPAPSVDEGVELEVPEPGEEVAPADPSADEAQAEDAEPPSDEPGR